MTDYRNNVGKKKSRTRQVAQQVSVEEDTQQEGEMEIVVDPQMLFQDTLNTAIGTALGVVVTNILFGRNSN